MAASKKRGKRITPWFVLTIVAISLIPTLLVLFGEGNITGAIISTLPIEDESASCYGLITCVNETITTCINETVQKCDSACVNETVENCSEQCQPQCHTEEVNGEPREVCITVCEPVCVTETKENCSSSSCKEELEQNCSTEIMPVCTTEEVCPESEIIEEPQQNESAQEQNNTTVEPEEPVIETSSLMPQDLTILNTPTISTLFLNTTNVTVNHTDVNLSVVNISSNALKIIYNWKRNNSPIATLIMPFEATNGSTVNNTIDFSGLGNNGNESFSNWSATAGYDGKGAYQFNGIDDFVTLNDNGYWKTLCGSGCTFSAWVKRGTRNVGPVDILTRSNAPGGTTATFFEFSTGTTGSPTAGILIGFNGSVGGNPSPRCSASSGGIPLDTVSWSHVVGVYNLSHTAIYINGTQQALTACNFYGINTTVWQNDSRVIIGARNDDTGMGSFFNGTIDELMVFNRSLTEAQIRALWLNQTNIIVAQETVRGENWTVFATPMNGTFNGTVVRSNNVTILNAKPTQATPLLNTTNVSSNNTNVNLTGINLSTADIDNDAVKNIYNWLLNGISIAVLNMPFEGVNSTSYNNTWDYSGYGNNGIIDNATWNATGGYDGKGAYQFNGSNGVHIGFLNNASLDVNGSLTLAAWTKSIPSPSAFRTILWHGSGSADYILRILTTGELIALFRNASTNDLSVTSTNRLLNNSWQHIAVVYDIDNSNLSLYIDGVMNTSNVSPGYGNIKDTGRFEIGNFFPTHTQTFNGTIDEVMVFNRSLSVEQIQAIYRNETDTIVAQETAVGDIWSVEVTPNDGFDDGQALISNNVTILNTKPTHTTPLLNTTNVSSNNTFVNLTAINLSTADTDNDAVKNIYNWLVDSKPIAVLNMPFEGINSTTSNNAWDYSGLGNNGSETNGVFWNATGGYDGKGAYQFDGIDDYINVSNANYFKGSLCINGCTFSAWAKGVKSGVPRIIGRWQSTGDDRFFLFGFSSTQQLSFIINPDGGPSVSCTANSAAGQFLNNTYQHVVGVYNLTNTAVYINGTLAGTTACSFNNISVSQWADEEDTRIGADAIGNQWNGTIDEVMIWNRSLSTEQIQALWQNKTNIIVAQETVRAEIWSVQITPNDGFDDGQMLQSNNVTILNIAPNITTLVLNSTNLTSNKTDVNLTAYATAFDSDGDSVKVIYNWFRNNSPISIINMPFEGINGTSSNNIWDYSSLGHNGSENGGGNWSATAGYDGKGAYQFDGQDDYLRINNSGHLKGTLCINGCTFSAWVYQGVNTQDQTIIGRWNTSNDDRFFLFRVGQGVTQAKTLAFEIGQDGGTTVCSGVDPAVESFLSNTWQHVVGRYNLTHTSVFINGTEQAAAACGSFSSITASAWEDAEDTLIGTESDGGPTQTWNGTIDEIMIFNRSLSLEQIQNLARNKTDVLVHQETASGEVWNVSVTPNDGFDDGQTLFSNSIRILDSTAPTVTITTPADGSNFSSGNQLFRAAVTDDESGVDSVRFMFNTNTTPFNATVSINGPSWDATVDMATITEGLHTVTAFANDTVGNVNQSVNITITVDRTPPNVSIFFVNDTSANNTNHTNSGVIQINATLNDTLTTVTHVRFGIFNPRNNSEFNLTTIKLGSFWTQDISLSTLTDAVYTIRVYGNDTLGNLNNSVSNLSFTVDTTPPNVSIFFMNVTPLNASNFTNTGVIQINATLNDTLTTVTHVRFGIFNPRNNSEFNLTTIKLGSFWTQDISLSTLTDAVYTIRVYGNDTLGNLNNSVSNLSFIVDTTPPNVSIFFTNDTATNNSNHTNSGVIQINVTLNDTLTTVTDVRFGIFNTVNNSEFNLTTIKLGSFWTQDLSLATLTDAVYFIRVYGNDTLGNMNNSVINLSFTVDATPPTVNITNPSNGVTLSGTQTFSATVRDATTVVNTVIFQFSAGTTAINRTASNTSGNWNVSIDTTILAEDSQTIITVFANDTLGNMNRTETITVTIDNVVAGGVTGGGGGGPSQGKPPKEAPEAAYLCGNGDLENGEECDAGDGCTAECTCSSGYMPKHEVDCELLPYCGDGEINGGEECDGADLDGKTCNSLEYAEGKLSCSSSCTLDSNECITYEEIYNKLLTEIEGILPESGSSLDIDQKFEQAKNLFEEKKFKEAYELLLELKGDLKVYQLLILPGKKIFSGIGKSVQEDTGYWLLSGMVGLLVLAGYYVKGLPIKEYVWKLKPVPEVRIKEPLTTPSSITAKPSKPLTLLGKKSYVDLQQQLEQVDKLLEEVPVPETTNAVKLTSLRNGSEIGTKKPIISIKNIEELEQWVDKMLLLKTPEAKMTEIIQKVTNFSNGEISIALQRVKATKLLQERYSINDKAVAELKKFISREFKKGASPQQIITDLVQEGWDMRTIKPYVIAYYN